MKVAIAVANPILDLISRTAGPRSRHLAIADLTARLDPVNLWQLAAGSPALELLRRDNAGFLTAR